MIPGCSTPSPSSYPHHEQKSAWTYGLSAQQHLSPLARQVDIADAAPVLAW